MVLFNWNAINLIRGMKRTFLVALGLSACVADSRVISLEREQF